jgi:hypothetical protein
MILMNIKDTFAEILLHIQQLRTITIERIINMKLIGTMFKFWIVKEYKQLVAGMVIY